MQNRNRISADSLTALVLIVVFTAYGLYGSQLESSLGVDFVGPDFFPKAISIFAVFLAVVLLIQDRVRARAVADQGNGADSPASGWFNAAVAVPFAMMLAYVMSLDWLGFPIATFAFLVISLRYLGCPSWVTSAVFGLLGTGAAVLLFHYGLYLRLPQGVIVRLW